MALAAAHLKDLRSLQTPKGRREHGCFLIEGEKLLREAVAAGAPIVELLATEARQSDASFAGQPPPTPMSAKDAERLSDTRAPQGCFAVVRDSVPTAAQALAALDDGPHTLLALDAVQDPGNAGALIRVAAAFGVELLLAGPGTADPTNPKVVRAATGAWFQTGAARSLDLAADLAGLAGRGYAIIGADTVGAPLWQETAPPARRVLVLGSEGAGFSPAVDRLIGQRLRVPIAEGIESLNVAVAAGIILSAWARDA